MQRGQAFSVFKILLGAVFAIALLVIVYSLVSGFNYPYSGFETTRDVVLQAMKSPGDCFDRSEVLFSKGETLSKNLAIEGINDIHFHPGHLTSVFTCGSSGCTVGTDINPPISVKCSTPIDCDVYLSSNNCK